MVESTLELSTRISVLRIQLTCGHHDHRGIFKPEFIQEPDIRFPLSPHLMQGVDYQPALPLTLRVTS